MPAPTQLTFKSTMIPALYRILSISTRNQSHRLLIHAVPVMAQLWGGPSDSRLYWDDLDNGIVNDSQLPVLGSYWDSFKNDGRQQQEEDFEMTDPTTILFKNNEHLLDILLTLETVLRLSLEPLPSKGLEPVFQVYQSGLGYDMMPDQVASLVQSVFKVHVQQGGSATYCSRKRTAAVITTVPNKLDFLLLIPPTIGDSDRMDKSTLGSSPILLHEDLRDVQHCRHPASKHHLPKPPHSAIRTRVTATIIHRRGRQLAKRILGIYEPTNA